MSSHSAKRGQEVVVVWRHVTVLKAGREIILVGRVVLPINVIITVYSVALDMAGPNRRDDLFDSILMADDRFRGEGYMEGFEEGERIGIIEGRCHGAVHGGKIASEVAFYYGFAFTWKCLLQNSTDVKAGKRLKTLETLIGMIQNFSHSDPASTTLQDDLDKVRSKFRQQMCISKTVSKGSLMV
ncbi:protein LTO1 homolog isoform X2 [Polypterus senegalus]|uniref:protein LTO1 homolog isoform X2 n=1 Tax=Polypterus senegalus TaxID=55291 RepID=UPI00196643B2|nr:protein LTO1 homolog isoform X2 [Polypterus senegalus]